MSKPSIVAAKSGTRYTVEVDGKQITDRTSKAKVFTHAVVRRNDDGWTASLAASEEKAAKTAATTPDRYTEIHTAAFEETTTARSLAEDINATIDAVAAEHEAKLNTALDYEVEHITADGEGYTYTEDPADLADGEGPQVAPDEDEGYYRIIDTAAPHGPVEIMQFRHIDLTGEESNPDEVDEEEDTDEDGPAGWVTVDPGFVDVDEEDEDGPAALADEEAPEAAPEKAEAPAPAPAAPKAEKAPETPEEAEAKRAARAERRRERLAKTEPEVLAERKAKINETRKAKRAAETPEEREARLAKRKAYRDGRKAKREAAKEAEKQTVNA